MRPGTEQEKASPSTTVTSVAHQRAALGTLSLIGVETKCTRSSLEPWTEETELGLGSAVSPTALWCCSTSPWDGGSSSAGAHTISKSLCVVGGASGHRVALQSPAFPDGEAAALCVHLLTSFRVSVEITFLARLTLAPGAELPALFYWPEPRHVPLLLCPALITLP